jgi:hypothetical protein
MADHAKLGPSSAERWMNCPGSVVLSEGMPNKSSEFADEGTKAHALAEALLVGEAAKGDLDMVENVMVYVDYVQSLCYSDFTGGTDLLVEQRVKVTDDLWGTADAVVWQPLEKHLHVVDLKFGAGVPVEIEGNLQLKIYALATLLTFGYSAERVTATIVQPRCPHSDGPVRSATYDVVDLLDFHADVLDAIWRVDMAHRDRNTAATDAWEGKYTKPSEKGCRWCLAAPKCPALKSKAQTLAKQVFAPGLPYDPKALADTLDFLPILEGWIKNTREFAYAEAEQGNAIPQWKLVEKRATRKWNPSVLDGDRRKLIEAGIDHADLYDPPSLKSPAAIEKLLPKEQRALLDELTVKESSGHTLVHESDKRPAIRVDAKSAFS